MDWLHYYISIIYRLHLYHFQVPLCLSMSYRAATVFCPVPSPSWDLSLGAAQVTLCLLDQEQLVVQGILLHLQLLQQANGILQLLLQREDGALFGFDLIHLKEEIANRKLREWLMRHREMDRKDGWTD